MIQDSLQAADSPDFYIFTSYLWENTKDSERRAGYGKHYYLPFHRERLIASAQALGWLNVADHLSDPAGIEHFIHCIEEHLRAQHDTETIARKVKVSIHKDTDVQVESAAIALGNGDKFPFPNDLDEAAHTPLSVVKLDTEPISPSLFTRHKTSERGQYDRARIAADIGQKPPHVAEILVFNPRNEVMECSMSTPYFRRNDRWVTPPLSSGGNAGVTRRIALKSGRCGEQIVRIESLRPGEIIWISNGVRGFVSAILHLNGAG